MHTQIHTYKSLFILHRVNDPHTSFPHLQTQVLQVCLPTDLCKLKALETEVAPQEDHNASE